MANKILFLTVVVFMFFGLSSFDNNVINGNNKMGDWELIGTKKVNFGLDKDVLTVGKEKGVFTKLKLVVGHGSLNMHRMVVHYGNGSKEEIELRHNFAKGSDSRVIDLKGKKRRIEKIVFWYDTKNKAKGKASLTIYGKH